MPLASTPPPALDLPALAQPQARGDAGWRTHRVRPGETLTHLAAAHDTTVAALAARNRLDATAFIHPGQRLQVPAGRGQEGASPRRSRRAAGGAHRPPAATVHVRPGDTLSSISARTGTAVGAIMRANGITDPRLIRPGQRLRLPGASGAPRQAVAHRAARPPRVARLVVVRPGETLGGIALREGTTVSALLKANRIHDARLIRPGQRLRVTGQAAAGAERRAAPARRKATPATARNTFAGRTYSDEVVASAEANRRTLARRAVPSRSTAGAMIHQAALRHGVDPRLAKAIAWQESGWDQRQVSVANAIGVMQVIPSTGGWISSLVGRDLDLLDADDNIEAGVVLLRTLDRSATSEDEAIAGYYQGLAGVRQNGMYPDTRQYVANVQHHKRRM